MNRTQFLKSLTCFGLAVTLLSCQDHLTTPSGPQRFRLKRTLNFDRSGPASAPVITTLSYNSSGKLASYTTANTANDATFTLQYNSQGQLVSREGRSMAGNLINSATFDSDASGNITTIKTYLYQSGVPSLNSTTQIEYNTDRLPSKAIYTFYGTTTTTTTTSYTYSNGNITTAREISNNGDYIFTYTYDDKPNPTYGLVGFDTVLLNLVNRNNAIYPRTEYEYNSNGLLIRVSENRGPQPTTTFEYEQY